MERDLVSATSTLTSGGAGDAQRPSMLAIPDARWQRMKEAARHIVWPGHLPTPRRHAGDAGGDRGDGSDGSDHEDAAASKAAVLGAATRCVSPAPRSVLAESAYAIRVSCAALTCPRLFEWAKH